jgi:murein L,D-transpeptidase YcbB/YkuD
VDQPFKLAEIVLGKDNGWPEKRIRKLIGGDERTINLLKPIPIHIMYFTTFVDERGGLQLRDDLYGYSAKVKLALGLRE